MDASSYAFSTGVRDTRVALARWHSRPLAAVGPWLIGSFVAAVGLLLAVLLVSTVSTSYVQIVQLRPPFVVGGPGSVLHIVASNLLVLALHALACVAGFIAGSSLPLQASSRSGISKWVHRHGGRIAITFVACATAFSLSAQAYVLGRALAGVSHFLKVSPAILLLGVLPHAVPELVALFLPLAAWIIASRRGDWDELLAATLVTVAIALPILVLAATIEVYVSPHLFAALTGIHPPIVRHVGGWVVHVGGDGSAWGGHIGR